MQKGKEQTVRAAARYGILVISVLFIGVGLLNQEHLAVLQKAVRICLGCIGIG